MPGFGDPDARLLLVGLAPAAHGANRTGRVFTGDGTGGSGDFLMSALHRRASPAFPTSQQIDDGLTLKDAYIAAAVRCAPPDNKPAPEEIARCLDHLDAEVNALPTRARRRRARQDRVRCVAAVAATRAAYECARGRSSAHGVIVRWKMVRQDRTCWSGAITRAGRIRIPES